MQLRKRLDPQAVQEEEEELSTGKYPLMEIKEKMRSSNSGLLSMSVLIIKMNRTSNAKLSIRGLKNKLANQ